MSSTAINLCDLAALRLADAGGGYVVPLLLADFLGAAPSYVRTRAQYVDSGAVVLDGPAAGDEGRVVALVALLQTVLGPRKIGRRIRCYRQGPKGGWREVRSDEATIRVSGPDSVTLELRGISGAVAERVC